jgi:hypothetical protein
MAAEREDITIGGDPAAVSFDPGDASALNRQRTDPLAIVEPDATFGGHCCQRAGEFEAVARLVIGKTETADDLFARHNESGFDCDASLAIEQFEGNTACAEDGDILGGPVKLLLRPEQSQRSRHPFVIGDARVGTQRNEPVAARRSSQ